LWTPTWTKNPESGGLPTPGMQSSYFCETVTYCRPNLESGDSWPRLGVTADLESHWKSGN